MKRYIQCNNGNPQRDLVPINIDSAMSDILRDPIQRRIYGKLMNLTREAVKPYLQGVLDLAELSNLDVSGILKIYEAIHENGLDVTLRSLSS